MMSRPRGTTTLVTLFTVLEIHRGGHPHASERDTGDVVGHSTHPFPPETPRVSPPQAPGYRLKDCDILLPRLHHRECGLRGRRLRLLKLRPPRDVREPRRAVDRDLIRRCAHINA